MNTILIIEDETAIAELEKDYLELSNFEVTIENDGCEGAARALNEDFDLIILDLMLPNMDGFEICKIIREKKNTPIIMVTAKKDDIDKIRGLGLGADDYITKPFSPSELVARVKAHLARYKRLTASGMPENEVIEIQNMILVSFYTQQNYGKVTIYGKEYQKIDETMVPYLGNLQRIMNFYIVSDTEYQRLCTISQEIFTYNYKLEPQIIINHKVKKRNPQKYIELLLRSLGSKGGVGSSFAKSKIIK